MLSFFPILHILRQKKSWSSFSFFLPRQIGIESEEKTRGLKILDIEKGTLSFPDDIVVLIRTLCYLIEWSSQNELDIFLSRVFRLALLTFHSPGMQKYYFLSPSLYVDLMDFFLRLHTNLRVVTVTQTNLWLFWQIQFIRRRRSLPTSVWRSLTS